MGRGNGVCRAPLTRACRCCASAQTLSAAVAAKQAPNAMFTYSNPNRALGEHSMIVDQLPAPTTKIVHQQNGQPGFGDDDFFLGASA
jgi:hypothetical protein